MTAARVEPPDHGSGTTRSAAPKATAKATVGVVGTLVWDTIHDRDPGAGAVQEWGGIAYALGGVVAALPEGWTVRPILKIGHDLAESALLALNGVPGVDVSHARVVPEPNNRVELRYLDRARRTERLSGGVPAWEADELLNATTGCDALYVNFISGFEMSLTTAQALRRSFQGPIYADLHSLFLSVSKHGDRTPRELPDWAAWLACFDAVQMNEVEFELLAASSGDPWLFAARVVGVQPRLIAVTLGERGAAFVAAPELDSDPRRWGGEPGVAMGRPVRSARVDAPGPPIEGDPTGCGDVWGAVCFARLLAGDGVEGAMREANRLARRNVQFRGASGLHRHLSGLLSTGVDRP